MKILHHLPSYYIKHLQKMFKEKEYVSPPPSSRPFNRTDFTLHVYKYAESLKFIFQLSSNFYVRFHFSGTLIHTVLSAQHHMWMRHCSMLLVSMSSWLLLIIIINEAHPLPFHPHTFAKLFPTCCKKSAKFYHMVAVLMVIS